MRVQRVAAVVALLTAALVVGVAAPADAGGDRIKARIAKHRPGPYKEAVKRTIAADQAKRFFIKVKNKDSEGLDVLMEAVEVDMDGFKQRYLRNGNNISPAVKGPGFDFHLDPGQVKRFELKVKANQFVVGPFCSRTEFEEDGGSGFDAVEARINGGVCN